MNKLQIIYFLCYWTNKATRYVKHTQSFTTILYNLRISLVKTKSQNGVATNSPECQPIVLLARSRVCSQGVSRICFSEGCQVPCGLIWPVWHIDDGCVAVSLIDTGIALLRVSQIDILAFMWGWNVP